MEIAASVVDVRGAIVRAAGADAGDLVERETHVSHVFLLGDRAFKLKKPVSFAFLDAGTPARRRELCREEVRLNRRLAPDVYLGVRAVVRTPRGFALAAGDADDGVEFLVEMLRFDEDATLGARLDRGEVQDADLVAVARRLVAFHANAPVIEPAGSPSAAVEQRMLENLDQLLAVVEQQAELERVLGLQRLCHAFVVAHAGLFEARARGGSIRDGHGDLRAEHVLIDGDVRIVDCLEFDPVLRAIDVGDDLAFLVMDLVAGHAERFARTLIRAYRDAGGDPGTDALLAFYACQHALVRAKVSLLRGAQQPESSAAHGHAAAVARDLLDVAERFAWQARLPLAIAFCGVPASGKSYLGESLAEISGLALLSSDVTRKELAGVSPTDRAGSAAYGAAFNLRTYAELGHRAALEVAARGGVLVDATFRHRADRDAFMASFGAAAPVLFVECRVPEAVLAQRARRREQDPGRVSDAGTEVVLRERTSWEPLDEIPARAHIAIRTDRPAREALAAVVAALDARLGGL